MHGQPKTAIKKHVQCLKVGKIASVDQESDEFGQRPATRGRQRNIQTAGKNAATNRRTARCTYSIIQIKIADLKTHIEGQLEKKLQGQLEKIQKTL